jgi:rubrerythrin
MSKSKSSHDAPMTMMNRTGIATHPKESEELIAITRKTKPSDKGDASAIDKRRMQAKKDADEQTIGSPPAPLAVHGGKKPAQQHALQMFLDKLGERLEFERTGVRLYDALIFKRRQEERQESAHTVPMPSIAALEAIRNDELSHFRQIEKAIRELGGDPTVLSPSADVAATISQGLPKVLTDPRADLLQGLQAILTAELADHEGWHMLITLAEATGHDDLVPMMRTALSHEEHHLKQVRSFVSTMATRIAQAHR